LELHYEDQLPISTYASWIWKRIMLFLVYQILLRNSFIFSTKFCNSANYQNFIFKEFEDSKLYLQSIAPDRCLPRIISLNDYPKEDNLLSELTTDQTDTTPFPDIYDLKEEELFTPWGDNIEEPCPKDENTPMPCRFNSPLQNLL
jgi:hypothetical protein